MKQYLLSGLNKKRDLILITVKFAILFLFSFGSWIIFTFDFEPATIISGFFFSIIVTLFSFNYFYKDDRFNSLKFLYRFDLVIIYFLMIIVESYISGFELISMMIRRKYNPGIIRIKTRLKSSLGRTFLSNSISLIPGTISLWMDGDKIFVHCFDKKTTHSIKAGNNIKGKLEMILMRLFG